MLCHGVICDRTYTKFLTLPSINIIFTSFLLLYFNCYLILHRLNESLYIRDRQKELPPLKLVVSVSVDHLWLDLCNLIAFANHGNKGKSLLELPPVNSTFLIVPSYVGSKNNGREITQYLSSLILG